MIENIAYRHWNKLSGIISLKSKIISTGAANVSEIEQDQLVELLCDRNMKS